MIDPLTSNQLLFGRKQVNSESNADKDDVGINAKLMRTVDRNINYTDRVGDRYWKRWQKEYVVSLRN